MTTTTASPAPAMPQPTSTQQYAIDFLTTRPSSGIWLDMGLGKTLVTLMALQQIRPIGHILVVAPKNIARSTWLDEIEKWSMPIRTRSLIYDERDRKLSRAKRLERFEQVFSDPPTMYFINQETLTQPVQTTNVLTPVNAPASAGSPSLSAGAGELLDLIRANQPITQEEAIERYRDQVALRTGDKPPSKKSSTAAAQELLKTQHVVRESIECRHCGGEGCRQCKFGLVDQMPIQRIDGKDTIIWPFRTVIIDESQGFKSHSSSRFKALKTVRPAIDRLIELTGTPAPNGLMDLWSQIYLLDGGQALGENITAYRDRWFVPEYVRGTNTPARWHPLPGAEEEIHQAISHLVISAKNTDLGRTEPVVNDVNVTLPADLMEAYKDFKRELVLDVVRPYQDENGKLTQSVQSIVAENNAVLTSKLMQFASGTLYTADPDDPSTKGDYTVIHDEKIQMAEYLIRNNNNSPVLLTYHFRSDKEQLLKKLTAAGIDAQEFDGSREMVRRWNAGGVQVMLVHPASAGHGLNLQHGGHTLLWYTLPFSLEHYLQTNKRLDRPGQTQTVTIHRLLTKGTHDMRMPSVLGTKKATQDRVIDAVDMEQALIAEVEAEIAQDIEDLNDMWLAGRL